MLRGTGIDDRVVLMIIESIHDHLRRSALMVVAAMLAVAARVETGGVGVSLWILRSDRRRGGRCRRRAPLDHQPLRAGHRPQPPRSCSWLMMASSSRSTSLLWRAEPRR